MKPLEKFAAEASGPTLVLYDRASSAVATPMAEQGHEVFALHESLPEAREWGAVALVVADRTELRHAAATLPRVGRSTAVGCLLSREPVPAVLLPRPDWPRVVRMAARRLPAGGAWTEVRVARPIPAHVVIRELAGHSSPIPVAPDRFAALGTGLEPGVTARPPEIVVLPDASVDVPYYDRAERRPEVLVDPDLAQGHLDEGVLNPIGFDPDPSEEMATLGAEGPTGLRLQHAAGVDALDPARGASAHVVAALRPHRAVRVSWDPLTPGLARAVAGLAMAGVPLVGDPPPASKPWLGDALHHALAAEVDLTDPLRREEHSVRLRRAALLTHSGAAWRERVARAAGRTPRRFPTLSVVLPTRRPEQLDFALRQVARQRSVDVELVVVCHGFEPDRGRFRDQLDGRPAEVLPLPADASFGDVLDAGVRATSGDLVVKMDDDDWYGRDFLLDLLLAREYSGADIVGTPAEFVYLQQLGRTVRGRATSDTAERFARFVAGGTLTVPRDLLHSLGGFRPVRRFVDRQLLHAATAAGATVYRGHGLGYLLRRTSSGHTWDPGIDFFLDPERVARQWQGFVPSRLLDVDPADLPDVAAGVDHS